MREKLMACQWWVRKIAARANILTVLSSLITKFSTGVSPVYQFKQCLAVPSNFRPVQARFVGGGWDFRNMYYLHYASFKFCP